MTLSERMDMELRRLEDVTDVLDECRGEPGTELYTQLMCAVGQIQNGMRYVGAAKEILEEQEGADEQERV